MFPNEIMTRRFAVGHNQRADGTISIARPWALPRNANPAGGISATATDQIAWTRFHLGDGRAPDGTRVLGGEWLERMRQPTVQTPGSALGDAIGISWMLRDVDGVRLVSHGGDTLGQHSAFVMVPEREFAIAIATNCGPNGSQLNEELVRWALEAYLGVIDRDPEPVAFGLAELDEYTGTYETIATVSRISAEGEGCCWRWRSSPRRWRSSSRRVRSRLRPRHRSRWVGNEGGPAQVWLLPAGGGEARRLTELLLGAGAPVWSPDGTRLAFTAAVDLAAAEGEDEAAAAQRRADAPVVADRLGYKADGAGLLRTVRQHLFVVEVASGSLRRLTWGDWHAGEPAWSPDGGRLAFSAAMAADADLTGESAAYVLDLSEARPCQARKLGFAP